MAKSLTFDQEQHFRRFATFRPSDRTKVENALRTADGARDVLIALKAYVEAWEDANWLEDYSIERIGKWFAISADDPFLTQLTEWARLRRTKARNALKSGLRKGASMSGEEIALAKGSEAPVPA